MFNHKKTVNNRCKGEKMEKFTAWDNEEVKTLFKFIEIKKSEGVPLVDAFSQYAECTFRHKNSVRNFYYKELESLQKDKFKAQSLGIDLNNHIVVKGQAFSKDEQSNMVKQIDNLINNGYSVRKACLKLSGGNVAEMLRYQNKYRAIKNTKKIKEKPTMGQIIKMPQKTEKLSEEDIKVLFLGLVRLVKKQEYENAKSAFETQLFKANEKLKHAIAEIAFKQNQIDNLREEIKVVKNKLEENQELLLKEKVSKVNKKSASNVLKNYFKGSINKGTIEAK